MDQRPTLYRVAHVASICEGLYNNETAMSELHDFDRHPMPYRDNGLEEFYDRKFSCLMRFAFGSLEQLKFWIYQKDVREKLAAAGYVVYVIEPEGEKGVQWEVGDTQAIYLNAREVGILDLRDI